MDVARSEFHPQSQATAAFAGDDRRVGRLAVGLFGDKAYGDSLLMTVSQQGCGIGIDNSTVEKT